MEYKHYPVLCKYDKNVSLPALVLVKCGECEAPLCSQCGMYVHSFRVCNECGKAMEEEFKTRKVIPF